ncbi:MAG TPA: hypothetical protein VGR45_01980 [Stellaceae bacterium]|nr:hypothetical protein [Stellaceae bacterium]
MAAPTASMAESSPGCLSVPDLQRRQLLVFRHREILPRGNASKVFAKNIGLNIGASFLLEMKNKPIPEGSPFP